MVSEFQYPPREVDEFAQPAAGGIEAEDLEARAGDAVEPCPTKRLRVLFVVDFSYWITATIARRLWRFNAWIEPGIISAAGLRAVLDAHEGRFPLDLDLVLFMSPSVATEFRSVFWNDTPCVVAIHHVHGPDSVEPVAWADAIMSVCSQWHDALRADDLASERFFLVRNSVDTAVFRPTTEAQRRKARAQAGIDDAMFCVGFSGKKSSDAFGRKGIDTFLAAAEQLTSLGGNYAFHVLGPGWSDVAAEMAHRGLKLVYRPFLRDERDVANFYRTLDCYWSTARIEGGPLPVLEAMASEVVPISTRVGAAQEVIRDGENGFLSDFNAPTVFVELTLKLAADGERRRRIGQAARETIVLELPEEEVVRPVRDMFSMATRRFEQRQAGAGSRPPRQVAWRDGRLLDLPRRTRSLISRTDRLDLLGMLIDVKADEAARRVALTALMADPADRSVARLAISAFPSVERLASAVRGRRRAS